MRQLPRALQMLASAFVTQFPVTQQPPHTQLTSADIDAFGLAQGVHPALPASPSAADLDAARNALVARLNKAGSARAWTASSDGFQIDVVDRLARPVIWAVKPLPVSLSHRTVATPDRNVRRIANQAAKTDRMYDAIDLAALPKEEQRVLTDERDLMLRLAQAQANIARVENAVLNSTLKKLAKKDPKSRLLP